MQALRNSQQRTEGCAGIKYCYESSPLHRKHIKSDKDIYELQNLDLQGLYMIPERTHGQHAPGNDKDWNKKKTANTDRR